MGFRIFNDDDGLRDAQSQLEAVKTDLEQTGKALNTLILEMEQTWTGDAAVEYISRLRQQLDEVCKLFDITDILSQTANERAIEMENTDNWFSNMINGLVNTFLSGVKRFLSVFGINL